MIFIFFLGGGGGYSFFLIDISFFSCLSKTLDFFFSLLLALLETSAMAHLPSKTINLAPVFFVVPTSPHRAQAWPHTGPGNMSQNLRQPNFPYIPEDLNGTCPHGGLEEQLPFLMGDF